MSQRTVEVVLGRLVTDESFRSAFFEEPDDVCSNADLDLTHGELSALLRVDEGLVAAVGARIQARRPSPTGENQSTAKLPMEANTDGSK